MFGDEGHSGATLVRPALGRLRDLVAGVGIEVVLCYSPDWLARKFAYQATGVGQPAGQLGDRGAVAYLSAHTWARVIGDGCAANTAGSPGNNSAAATSRAALVQARRTVVARSRSESRITHIGVHDCGVGSQRRGAQQPRLVGFGQQRRVACDGFTRCLLV